MVAILITIFGIIVVQVNGHPVDSTSRDINLTRIVGGVNAPEGYAPHMAALILGSSLKIFMCGGSIISKRYVLTAAHCIDPVVENGQLVSSFHAVVGSNLWNSANEIVRFSHFANHPLWDSERIKNDIGVLFLIEELMLNNRIAVVALSFEWVDGNVLSYVTGWGRLGFRMTGNIVIFYPFPDKLQILQVNTLSPKVCADAIEKSSSTLYLDSELEICTFHSLGHGMCYGDSGSPLMEEGTNLQIGIASWAFPCARGIPDVFVRISSYRDFLLPYIKNV